MKAIAFCPAHITGFFIVCLNEDYKKTGSKGAGINVSLGSIAKVEKTEKFSLDGNIGEGIVTKSAISYLTNEPFKIKIRNELPISQGFGISASSSLSACIAIASLLDIPYEKALEAVHKAEVENKCGLGDAAAEFVGGLEIRKEPGLKGKIEKVECEEKLILAIVGEGIETKRVLGNEKKIERINEIGEECLKEFISNPSLENFFDLSLKFSFETGIANEKIKNILIEANKVGKASMAMLGNSIFALYSKKMAKLLSKFKIYECFIDNYGARTLATFFP